MLTHFFHRVPGCASSLLIGRCTARSLLCGAAFAVSMLGTTTNLALAAGSASQYFQQAAGDRWVSRQLSLTELGFSRPTVLAGSNVQREIFLPVPIGIPLSDAAVQLNGSYLRADGGRTSMTLSLDDYPVVGRKLQEERGDVSQLIGIDGLPRQSGFVRLGVQWFSVVSDLMCSNQDAPGNALRIESDSRFSYRYDRDAIKTVAVAWSALPLTPSLLVSGRSLSEQAYDTAWRVGMALEHAGKRVRWVALPAVGDQMDMSKVSIPAELQGIPAFAALAGGGAQYKIKNAAEIGALVALGKNGPLRADVMLNDRALHANLQKALDALAIEIKGMSGDTAAAYAGWLAKGFTALTQQPGADQIQLALYGGNPVIMVSEGAGAKAAGLFDTFWRPLANGQVLEVKTVKLLKQQSSDVLLNEFGAMSGSMNIEAKGERTIAFDIATLLANGRVPDQVVFDVSAAPGADDDVPVVSIFLNDYLLGAQRLKVDGKPRRIAVNIPSYALSARNEIRISFLRQPSRIRCHDAPTSFPVTIFPSSHMTLKDAPTSNDFLGVAARYGRGSTVAVKSAWLNDAAATLPAVVRMASAAGLSAEAAQFQVVQQGAAFKPKTAFLGLDLPMGDGKTALEQQNGKLTLTGKDKAPLLDIAGLDDVAVAEVAEIGGEKGIMYRTIGKTMPVVAQPFRLSHGDVAVLNEGGPLLQFDKADPMRSQLADQGNPQSSWERYMNLWLFIFGAIIAVLIAARVAQVRRDKRKAAASKQE